MADKINAAGYETKPWWPYVRELMEGGGSVTVEQLNVTENGTYTAEAGKAYSPVVVNVAGGSSDFTTATLTIVVDSNIEDFGALVPHTKEASEIPFPLPANIDGYIDAYPEQENVYQVVLYKGSAILQADTENVSMTVTGDATVAAEFCFITGDCTITVRPAGS